MANQRESEPRRLAIVTSHPVQYYAPWFRHLTEDGKLNVRVFYLMQPGSDGVIDPGFGHRITWDIPLLDGYRHEFVPNRSSRPGSDRFLGLYNPELLARLQTFAPDAVLLIGYNAWSYLRLIFARWPFRTPYPLLFRGDSHRLVPRPNTARERLRRALIRTVYRRFARVLYVGRVNRDYFRWHGVPEERLFFSPHAVDNARFISAQPSAVAEGKLWRRAIGVADGRLLVMFAGKFEDKKRPLDLLAAFGQIAPDLNASLVFVGAGHLEQKLHAWARGNPHVHFAPFQNQSRMPATYAAADLFVLPSYGDKETWGLAINEALCLQRPVVVSDHVGCAADLVEPGVNGLVFPAGDVDALASALRDALSDRARLLQWGQAGRRRVARYDYEQASQGLMQALSSLSSAAICDDACRTDTAGSKNSSDG